MTHFIYLRYYICLYIQWLSNLYSWHNHKTLTGWPSLF